MGTEVAWVPWAMAALSAAGTGASVYNTQQTAKRQDNILAGQIQQNSARQSEADRAVGDALRDRSLSGAEQDRASTGNQYLDQVRAAQASATQGLGQAGAVSNAYRQAANDAALGVGDYAAKTAGLMARIDAPAQQRQREALASDQLRTDLGLIGRRSAGDDFIAQLKLRNVRPNPWVGAASQLMSGAAQGMAGRAGAGATAAGGGGMSQFGSEAGSWFSDPSLWRTS